MWRGSFVQKRPTKERTNKAANLKPLKVALFWALQLKALDHNIWLDAAHLPGKDNIVTDQESRSFHDRTE